MKKGLIGLLAISTLFGIGLVSNNEKVNAANEKITYTLVSDASTLKVNDIIVIAAAESNYALSTTQNSNNRGQTSITKNDNLTITFDTNVQLITLEEGEISNTFAFNVGNGYLYAASGSSNHLKTKDTKDANGSWKITIDDNIASIIAQGSNSRNDLRHTPGSSIFSCYASNTSSKKVQIYKQNIEITQTEQLKKPLLNINESTGEVTWNKVENAIGYVYEIDGVEDETTEPKTVTLLNQKIRVKAIGDGTNYEDSSWSDYAEYYIKTQYSKVTDSRLLNIGDQIIVASSANNTVLGTTQNDNNRSAHNIEIKEEGKYAYVKDSIPGTELITLEAGSENGTYALKTSDNKYLYYPTGSPGNSTNYLRTTDKVDATSSWNISISASGEAVIRNVSSPTYTIRYNKGNNIYSCYLSGQNPVSIYKLGEYEEYVEPIRDAEESDIAGINNLVSKYKNEGYYVKDTKINLTRTAANEISSMFHAGSTLVDRTTYYNGGALWMTNGNNKFSYYGTKGSDMTHGTVTNLGDTVETVAIKGKTMEEYYITMNDIVADINQDWKVKEENGTVIYKTGNKLLVDWFKAFTAPCYLGFDSKTENYIDLVEVEIEETSKGLEMRLIASSGDIEKFEDGTNVFSTAIINQGWGHYSYNLTDNDISKISSKESYVAYGLTWNYSDTTEGSVEYSIDNKGLKIGANSKEEIKHADTISFKTNSNKTIKEIIVNTSGNTNVQATLSVKVNGENFKCNGEDMVNINAVSTNYTFIGNGSGEISIDWTQTSTVAIYIKSITIVYAD